MIYNVLLFNHGKKIRGYAVEAGGHRQALNSMPAKETYWTNAIVTSATHISKRYNNKFRRIHGTGIPFKITYNEKPSILVMIGKYAEIYQFKSQEIQESEFICMTSALAASAETDKEPKDTIASSVETSDSKSGSTSMRTSSGFVMSAIWLDSQTHWSIDNFSGIDKLGASVAPEWSASSNYSHSKQKPTFAMNKKNGKTVQVNHMGHAEYVDANSYHIYNATDLDFTTAKLTIDPKMNKEGLSPHQIANLGKTLVFTACSDHWNDGRNCWVTRNLMLPTRFKKGKLVPTRGTSLAITARDVKDLVGKVVLFQKKPSDSHWRIARGAKYYIDDDWIDWNYERETHMAFVPSEKDDRFDWSVRHDR